MKVQAAVRKGTPAMIASLTVTSAQALIGMTLMMVIVMSVIVVI